MTTMILRALSAAVLQVRQLVSGLPDGRLSWFLGTVWLLAAVYRSNIESRSLSWGYAAWWYSLISPATTGLRRMDRRSATSRTGCVSMSGGRCRRDWCGLWPL
jgi:hypothetical protein